MGLYNVVTPGVVGDKHYTRPAKARDVDDAVAAPLVEAGTLEPVDTALDSVKRTVESVEGDLLGTVLEPPAAAPQPRARARRTEG